MTIQQLFKQINGNPYIADCHNNVIEIPFGTKIRHNEFLKDFGNMPVGFGACQAKLKMGRRVVIIYELPDSNNKHNPVVDDKEKFTCPACGQETFIETSSSVRPGGATWCYQCLNLDCEYTESHSV